MTITKKQTEAALELALNGRLDTATAPELEKELASALKGVSELTLDFAALDYISSAGLRVLLSAQRTMSKQGSMKIKNVNEIIMEIFVVTGFSDILTIE
jgi:anti-sigma B factor antagonist